MHGVKGTHMSPRKKTAAPFQTIDAWHNAYPSDTTPAADLFDVIPPAVRAELSTKSTHDGPEALAVWQTVSVQMMIFRENYRDASIQNNAQQFFANVGFFTTLASLFEDRLNALFVARSKMVFGAAYSESEAKHATVLAKSDFLRDYDDIAAEDERAMREYSAWRNAVAHQAHYNHKVLCAEVFTAVEALFLSMQRMRNRQKTILKNETKYFPTADDQWAAVGRHGETLTAAISRQNLHELFAGGTKLAAPFRHGAPIYVLKPSGATRIVLARRIKSHQDAWLALHGKQWQVPVFVNRVYSGIHTVTLHMANGSVELAC